MPRQAHIDAPAAFCRLCNEMTRPVRWLSAHSARCSLATRIISLDAIASADPKAESSENKLANMRTYSREPTCRACHLLEVDARYPRPGSRS